MRSTRASAAVARLNARSTDQRYVMSVSGTGLFKLHQAMGEAVKAVSEALPLDDFVVLVNSLGPQKVRRVTKDDAAFARQLRGTPSGEEPVG